MSVWLRQLLRMLLLCTYVFGVVAQLAGATQADQIVRIAYIDPLTGPFANVGEMGLRHFEFAVEDINARKLAGPGIRLEVKAYDNKGTPQESLTALQAAIDDGARIITQGNGSGAALALVDALNKYNERNAGREILYLNYAAVDPDLTNSHCSFWHFRFDANSEMKLEALTDFMKDNTNIHNVYLINQNYAHGVQVARAAREYLARKRPDIHIVGDDLHPLGQVKDFSPYVAKIKAAGADTVITGNWGTDMTLLIKAAKDAGVKLDFYTFYAGGLGSPTAIGEAGIGNVKQVSEWHANVVPNYTEKWANAFKKRYKIDFYYLRINNEMNMLAKAIRQTRSTDSVRIAYELEDMRWMSDTGEIHMRAGDHQLLQPLFISTIQYTAAKGGPEQVKYDVEDTGLGFMTDSRLEPYISAQPTSCNMKKPARPQ